MATTNFLGLKTVPYGNSSIQCVTCEVMNRLVTLNVVLLSGLVAVLFTSSDKFLSRLENLLQLHNLGLIALRPALWAGLALHSCPSQQEGHNCNYTEWWKKKMKFCNLLAGRSFNKARSPSNKIQIPGLVWDLKTRKLVRFRLEFCYWSVYQLIPASINQESGLKLLQQNLL